MNTAQPMYEWNTIPWRKLERNVFKLQRRIYQASKRGDSRQVKRLQRLLIKSWSAKTLAVRKVTQDNTGKKTAGVDGVKSLTPIQRLELIKKLNLNDKPKAIRRVWIPKPGKNEKRPLGIPVMKDRATQALVKMAIEPQWEAKFEPNSYGFRPGRSCHDALQALHDALRHHDKYALDADIAGCFDNINHEALIKKMNISPYLRRIVKLWLKAGVLDNNVFHPNEKGTPQGGVISPLLANIALHGMENLVKSINRNTYMVRYADDFVVLHNELKVIEKCKEAIEEWLNGIGLELKPSKTRVVNTLNKFGEEKAGFNFLGCNVRQYPVSINNSGKRRKGFKTIIQPSKESIQKHKDQIKTLVKQGKAKTQIAIINELNPIIRGWTNYFSPNVSSEAFKYLTHFTVQTLMKWGRKRHPKKSRQWVNQKYFGTHEGYQWTFMTGKFKLLRHSETKIIRWVKVSQDRSPYDGDWVYWSTRMARHPEANKKVAYLLNQQKGKCSHCGYRFNTEDLLEIHHIDKNHRNNKWENLTLLHRHCHDEVHMTSA
ncbi:group II intron reverse transcriptase/maturase [Fischerella thermalis CCMEE 5319]|nr:group II intron reverse transcriptase/maturase [Fischerella thermalis CCMEE 5319]